MSRVETANLALGCWDESDNPGAGSKTVVSANTGLNGNWLILDTAVGTGHTAAGAHASDVIDGPNLKTTVADGVAIQLTGTPLKLNLKDGGIATAKIADDAVTADKLADGCIDAAAKLAADVVITAKILDANVTLAKLAADSVDATKMAHDNKRVRQLLTFVCSEGESYYKHNGVATASGYGPPMPHAGMIVEAYMAYSGGDSDSDTQAYASSGAASTGRFAAGDKISVAATADIRINGTSVTNLDFGGTSPAIPESGSVFMTLVLEFDD